MAAYMIVTAAIRDREKFISGYGAAAAALIEKFGGQYLLRGPGAECLEGEFGDNVPGDPSIVISKWPDRAAIRAFWNSAEYGEAKKLREGLAEVQVLVIDGPDLIPGSG